MTPEVRTNPDDEAMLVAYVDGDLGLVEAAAFEQRLASEPALAAALHSFLAADELGKDLGSRALMPRTPLPPGQATELRTAGAEPTAGAPPRRHRLRLLDSLLFVMAAITVIALMLQPAGRLQCRVASLEPAPSRGGSVTGLRYRLELSPARASHVALFAVTMQADGLAVVRQFPPHPAQLASDSQWQSFPANPLPVGQTTIPPLEADPFEVRCAPGVSSALALVVHSSQTIDHTMIEAAMQELRRTVTGRVLDQSTAAELVRVLEARGWAALTVWLRVP